MRRVDQLPAVHHRLSQVLGILEREFEINVGAVLVERYRLNEDGTRIAVEFVLEDPEFIAEPLVDRRELIYSPHEEMYRFNCDPTATSRFVR